MKNSLSKILITGANGQLGMALRHHPRAASYHLIPCSHADLDITDPASIQRAITTFSPDMVMNCAAYTAVDKAEQDLKQALNVNYIGAQNLAIACDTNEIPLIHVSTDYVFDGTHTIPYQEHDLACPINVYGDTKWRGEQVIREACKQHIVLRVSGVFSEYGNNFLKTILRLAQEKKELRIVADQITCPTYAGDIADVLFTIAQYPSRFGTYHYCNTAPVSWHQFATAIVQIANTHQSMLVEEIKAIRTSDYPTAAKRPAYSVLDCSKIKNDFNIQQSTWNEALSHVIPTLLRQGIRS